MERGKKKTTTTTTTTTRKTLNVAAMAESVQHTRLRMGGLKSVRANAVIEKQKTENSDSEETALMNESHSNSDSADANCSRDQRSLYQATTSSKMKVMSSNTSSTYSPRKQVLKKSRSEPMKVSSRSESELRKARSEHWDADSSESADHVQKNDAAAESVNVNVCDLDHHEQSNRLLDEDLMIDSREEEVVTDRVEQEVSDDVVNECDTEVVVAESPKEKVVFNDISGDHVDDMGTEGEHNMILENDGFDEDTCDDYGRDGGGGGGGGDAGDELIQVNDSKEYKIVDDSVVDPYTSCDDGRGGGGGGGDGDDNVTDANTCDGGGGGGDDNVTNANTCDGGGGGGDNVVDNDDIDAKTRDGGGGGGDGLIPLNISKKHKTKKVVSAHINKFNNSGLPKSTATSNPSMSPTKPATSASVSTPTATLTSTSACYKPVTTRSNHRSNLKHPTTDRETSKQNDVFTTPQTHGKLQTLVDLVMWRDISRSAFIFGIGTFVIISSSYAKDFEFSFISVASYMSLIYLAVVFLYKSFMCREMMDKEDCPELYIWGEEEALWLVKLILPYLNELLVKLRGIFSGDPAMTMKLAVVLFVLARCGSSITLWKTVKLGFFGVFIVPKLCSSYSTHISAYGNFWVRRFRDVWESCSHKKALAFAIFTLVWNYSSVTARTWAAFMLFVAFRYYQQSLITQDFVEEQQPEPYNVHIRHLARNRCRVPTSLDQRKQKKSF